MQKCLAVLLYSGPCLKLSFKITRKSWCAGGGDGGGDGNAGPPLRPADLVVMQRAVGPVGGGVGVGPMGLQGPPRSIKISPVKIQDESGDPMSQSEWIVLFLSFFFFLSSVLVLSII